MLLKRIKLRDFRCYLSENEIEFATDPERNITLIHGENGVGKTALLNAIMWTFFEKLTSNFRNQKDLLNHAAKKSGRTSCSVEIEFEEEGRDFLIKRTHYHANPRTKLQLWEIYENGTFSAEKSDPAYFINGTIPPEMAEYFFFQGEGSSAVEDKNKEGVLANAIRNILGFKVATSLRDTLKKIEKDVRKQKAGLDTSGEATRIEAALSDSEEKLARSLEKTEETKGKLDTQQVELKNADAQLEKIKNKDLQSLRDRERRIMRDLKAEKNDRVEIKKQKIGAIKEYAWAVFGADFADQSQDFIDESVISGNLPEPYNQKFIKGILSEKICICGACLAPGSEAWNMITGMLATAANPVLQNRLLGIRAHIDSIQTLSKQAPDRIKEISKKASKNEHLIEDLGAELKSVINSIKEIPEEAITRLQTKKSNLGQDIARLNRELGAAQQKIETLNREIKQKKAELGRLQPNSDLLGILETKVAFLQDMQSCITTHLDKAESDVRTHVYHKVNNILEQFSRHDYKIRVSPGDFKIHLVDRDDNIAGHGDGLNLLLNLTITVALIEFAADRKNVKDSILSAATVAPLVIDAPFGVLDDAYRKVVVSHLPKHAKQLVFFVSSSQWSREMDDEVRARLGREYCLVMEESSPQEGKDIDEIDIRGERFVLSKYGQTNRRTSLMEVSL